MVDEPVAERIVVAVPLPEIREAQMGQLIYSSLLSLDGYVVDEQGNFDWAEPADDVHAFINDLQRSIGTNLYGRRMYEVMSAWETMDADRPVSRDFAEIWRATDKVVYSSTLDAISTARTTLEPAFDPDAVRGMKANAGHDLSISGPTLAASAIAAGLVDEWQLFVVPHVVGGGTSFFPPGARTALTLVDERRFGNGTVHLRYRSAS